MTYLIIVLVVLLAYLYGCLSTARIVAKTFRSLNIYLDYREIITTLFNQSIPTNGLDRIVQ